MVSCLGHHPNPREVVAIFLGSVIMTDRACATCQFFDHEKDGEGTCRADPPQRDDTRLSGFPSTRADWWCGRWFQQPGAPTQIYEGEASSINIFYGGRMIKLTPRGKIVTITVQNPKAEDDEELESVGLGALFG